MRSKDFRQIELLRERTRRKAKTSFIEFIKYVNTSYKFNWHHKYIANKLQDLLIDPKKNKLILSVPPQHGKSELSSRHFPAFALGVNPDLKIILASYSTDLSHQFNRDVQKIIEGDFYNDVFPETRINSKNIVTTQSWLKNTEIFEVINKKGSLKAVGVGSGLTGRQADIAIIDDPIKDDMEAQSATIRENIWNWYTSVLMTRLHNNSKQIIIMTRWHEDDLIGRLLNPDINPNWNEWDVVNIKAIATEINEHDPREIGEALWPERHSLDKLLNYQSISPTKFNALYQGEPTTKGGNKIKEEWFRYEDFEPFGVRDMWIDGAYTKNTSNDPTGIMITVWDEVTKTLYVTNFIEKHLEMPDLIKEIVQICNSNKISLSSKIYLEPKASGKSTAQMLNRVTNIPAIEINNYLVNEGKESRISVAAPYFESGRVVLIKGHWNHKFKEQLKSFPKAKHDEAVDLIGYAVFHYFKPGRKVIFDNPVYLDNLF